MPTVFTTLSITTVLSCCICQPTLLNVHNCFPDIAIASNSARLAFGDSIPVRAPVCIL